MPRPVLSSSPSKPQLSGTLRIQISENVTKDIPITFEGTVLSSPTSKKKAQSTIELVRRDLASPYGHQAVKRVIHSWNRVHKVVILNANHMSYGTKDPHVTVVLWGPLNTTSNKDEFLAVAHCFLNDEPMGVFSDPPPSVRRIMHREPRRPHKSSQNQTPSQPNALHSITPSSQPAAQPQPTGSRSLQSTGHTNQSQDSQKVTSHRPPAAPTQRSSRQSGTAPSAPQMASSSRNVSNTRPPAAAASIVPNPVGNVVPVPSSTSISSAGQSNVSQHPWGAPSPLNQHNLPFSPATTISSAAHQRRSHQSAHRRRSHQSAHQRRSHQSAETTPGMQTQGTVSHLSTVASLPATRQNVHAPYPIQSSMSRPSAVASTPSASQSNIAQPSRSGALPLSEYGLHHSGVTAVSPVAHQGSIPSSQAAPAAPTAHHTAMYPTAHHTAMYPTAHHTTMYQPSQATPLSEYYRHITPSEITIYQDSQFAVCREYGDALARSSESNQSLGTDTTNVAGPSLGHAQGNWNRTPVTMPGANRPASFTMGAQNVHGVSRYVPGQNRHQNKPSGRQ